MTFLTLQANLPYLDILNILKNKQCSCLQKGRYQDSDLKIRGGCNTSEVLWQKIKLYYME